MNSVMLFRLRHGIASNPLTLAKTALNCKQQWKPACPIIAGTNQRNYATKEIVQDVIKTQSGFFKALSESTPVEVLQQGLVDFHNYSGMSWWSTIVCSTIILRTVFTLPLMVYQQSITARLELLHLEMADIVQDLRKEVAVAIKKFEWDERTTQYHYKRSLKKQWNQLIVRENCHPMKAALLPWIQIPLWVTLSVSLRNLVYMLPEKTIDAQVTFMELTVGGVGWIPDLTIPDGSLALPIALGIMNLSIIELQLLTRAAGRPTSKLQKYVTNFFRGFSILMIPLAACVPSCLAIYWTTSSAYGLVQNMMLLSPAVKRALRIPKAPSERESPYKHLAGGLKDRFTFGAK